MGMFDYVRSSYYFDDRFNDKTVFQTKDIEDGIGGTLTDYWIDPSGQLWYSNYRDTHTFEVINEDDPRYDPNKKFLNFEWVPTGARGKYQVHPITKYIEIYPENWKGKWEQWPQLRLHFKYGKLQDYEDVTRS
jgi:hypothetical protein